MCSKPRSSPHTQSNQEILRSRSPLCRRLLGLNMQKPSNINRLGRTHIRLIQNSKHLHTKRRTRHTMLHKPVDQGLEPHESNKLHLTNLEPRRRQNRPRPNRASNPNTKSHNEHHRNNQLQLHDNHLRNRTHNGRHKPRRTRERLRRSNTITHYGSRSTDPNWDPQADLNGDDVVNMYDATMLLRNYGYPNQ